MTHVYPNATAHRTAPASEITVIDTARAVVADRIAAAVCRAWFSRGVFGRWTTGRGSDLHPKNLVPLAHLEHGGAFADTLTLFGADVGKTVEVPLDELERYAVRPFGSRSLPTSHGSSLHAADRRRVTVIDIPRLLRFVRAHPGSVCAGSCRLARTTWWRG